MSALSLSASESVDWVSSVAISTNFLFENLLKGQGEEGWIYSGGATSGSGSSQKLLDNGDVHSIGKL